MSINIKNIVGYRFINIGRCLDLCWMIFESNAIEYSLHLQCAWRITVDRSVLLTNMDIIENYDDNSYFDKSIERFRKSLEEGVFVEEVSISKLYDVSISLSNSWTIEIFINDKEECWRFFGKGKEETQQVVCANNMEYHN